MKRKPYVMLFGIIFTLLCPIVLPALSFSAEPSLADYTAYPPFLDQAAVPPNVLLLLDNSGSMNEFSYKTRGTSDNTDNPDASFDPSVTYYGYFNSNSKYSYSTSSGGYFYENLGGAWNGNFLNWLTMRRIDVVRRVLVGGKCINRANPSSVKYLVGTEDPDRNFYKRVTSAGSYTPFSGTRCFNITNNGSLAAIFVSTDTGGSCSSFTAGSYSVKVEIGTQEPTGVVHRTWDKVRFGLMFFNNGNKFEDGGSTSDGGFVADWITGPGANVNLVTQIENTDPLTWTPLAEALYEATRYFRAGNGAYAPQNYAAHDPVQQWCQKNFVLVLTDGESTKDRNVPGGAWGAWGTLVSDPDGFNVRTYMDLIATNEGYASQSNVDANSSQGTYYLEGVAYWAHTTDLRKDWQGTQNLITYTLFAFDDSPVGRDLLMKTAKYGGFDDLNGNKKPDLPSEWDRNSNGIPDTFFEARGGYELEERFLEAIVDMLRRTASGTAVSVIATTGEGEGAVYQAYFYPSRTIGYKDYKWLGYLQALFVDAYGNLREDTNGNKRLDGTDLIISMWYDYEDKKVMVDRFIDVDGNGILDCVDTNNDGRIDTCGNDQKFDTIFFDEIHPLWEAGSLLFSRDPDTRKIYTTLNGSTFLSDDFNTSNATVLRPYLRAATDAESSNIIRYIRGTDFTGYRSRTFTIGTTTSTWKLGDIVYSTPSVTGKPYENFDYMYADSTYTTYRTTYKTRRQVVYVGANDGMFHAFNAGFYDTSNHQFHDPTGHSLGEELWAFIPRDLLPHLKWLMDVNYTHVYYVDLKPRVADVRIFNNDMDHPGGWGTILIGGMRYGGKKITVSDASFPGGSMTFYSTYFALDVTDPLKPRLLWTFTDTVSPDDLGLTLSYPAIVRIRTDSSKSNSEDPGRWFAVFGSGPTAYNGSSTNTAKVYALDLSSGTNGAISSWSLDINYWKFSTGDSNGFMADAIAVDVDRDYVHDVVYIGDTFKATSWQGKMFRLVTRNIPNPAFWTLSTLFNAGKPVTASASTSKDKNNNLWVFFGTGRFLHSSDDTSTDQQSFYGIKDICTPWFPASYSCITTVSQANLLDVTNAVVSIGGYTVTGVSGVTNWVSLLGASESMHGWYVRFPILGERNFVKPLVIGGLVVWATYVPSTDLCSPEGVSYAYAVYFETGTGYKEYVFIEEKTTQPAMVGRSKYLGLGAPSSIVGMLTKVGEIKGFAQTSTGAIKEFGFEPAVKSYGFKGWKMGGIR